MMPGLQGLASTYEPAHVGSNFLLLLFAAIL